MDEIDLRLASVPASVAAARRAVVGLDELAVSERADASLLVSEVVTNSLRHAGVRGRARSSCAPRRTTRLSAWRSTDPGPGFERRTPQSPAGGRGSRRLGPGAGGPARRPLGCRTRGIDPRVVRDRPLRPPPDRRRSLTAVSRPEAGGTGERHADRGGGSDGQRGHEPARGPGARRHRRGGAGRRAAASRHRVPEDHVGCRRHPDRGPRGAVPGADAVVHLAWLIQPGRREDVTHSVNVEGTARVFRAAVQAGVGAVVYASSVGAYAPGPKDRAVDEAGPRPGYRARSTPATRRRSSA